MRNMDDHVLVPVQVKGRLVEEGVVLPHKLTTYKKYNYVRTMSTCNCVRSRSTYNCKTVHSVLYYTVQDT